MIPKLIQRSMKFYWYWNFGIVPTLFKHSGSSHLHSCSDGLATNKSSTKLICLGATEKEHRKKRQNQRKAAIQSIN